MVYTLGVANWRQWQTFFSQSWQISGKVNLGRGKLEAWQTRGILFRKMR